MNETLKVLETRRSCRNFDSTKMVSEEDIQAIVKAGTYAATGLVFIFHCNLVLSFCKIL